MLACMDLAADVGFVDGRLQQMFVGPVYPHRNNPVAHDKL